MRPDWRILCLAATFVVAAVRSNAQQVRVGQAPSDPAAVLQAEERIARSEAAMGRTFDPAFGSACASDWRAKQRQRGAYPSAKPASV
jgi:hypothetical protein